MAKKLTTFRPSEAKPSLYNSYKELYFNGTSTASATRDANYGFYNDCHCVGYTIDSDATEVTLYLYGPGNGTGGGCCCMQGHMGQGGDVSKICVCPEIGASLQLCVQDFGCCCPGDCHSPCHSRVCVGSPSGQSFCISQCGQVFGRVLCCNWKYCTSGCCCALRRTSQSAVFCVQGNNSVIAANSCDGTQGFDFEKCYVMPPGSGETSTCCYTCDAQDTACYTVNMAGGVHKNPVFLGKYQKYVPSKCINEMGGFELWQQHACDWGTQYWHPNFDWAGTGTYPTFACSGGCCCGSMGTQGTASIRWKTN